MLQDATGLKPRYMHVFSADLFCVFKGKTLEVAAAKKKLFLGL